MARVFISYDHPPEIRQIIIELCTEEGHKIVGIADTVEATLKALGAVPYPVVAIVERDHSSDHPTYPLFPTMQRFPTRYRRHRYIALHNWTLTEEDRALLSEFEAIVFPMPFDSKLLLAAITYAASLLDAEQADDAD